MRTYMLLTLQVALLAVIDGIATWNVTVEKCCREYQMLSGDGRTCVEADWPRNASFVRQREYIVPPLDEAWVSRWLPPGLTTQNISGLRTKYSTFNVFRYIVRVNASSMWDKNTSLNMSRNRVTFGRKYILRPNHGGRPRKAFWYCVDAALPPQGPFVMLLTPLCTLDECATKCCNHGNVLGMHEGNWECVPNSQGDWHPLNASFANDIDSEFPFRVFLNCLHFQLAPSEDRSARWARSMQRVNHFSNWRPCFDYYRRNGNLEEGLFYCEIWRVARGVYWLLRPLCVVSTSLLAGALISIACDRSMRRKAHGWCLATHASCLFAFNVGQVVYYVTISDLIDGENKITPGMWKGCRYFALVMYFLLTAAWFWLTALCLNMANGFRIQAPLAKKSGRMRFIALSVFAWGFPAVLTTTCSYLFTPRAVIPRKTDTSWYNPTLMETRVCYNEPVVAKLSAQDAGSFSVKRGTALFYFGPVLCLMLCNIVCLALTLKKVQYLKRGNSLLRREEQRKKHPEESNSPTGNMENGNGRTCGNTNGSGSRLAVDAKTIKLYIKMLLMTGAIELITEVIIWTTTTFSNEYPVGSEDYHFRYRASGYVTDFFRAACVAWMAAPKGGYLDPLLRRLRGKKNQKLPPPIQKGKKSG